MKFFLKNLNDEISELNKEIKHNYRHFLNYQTSEEKRSEDVALDEKYFKGDVSEFQAKSYLVVPNIGIRLFSSSGDVLNYISASTEYSIEVQLKNMGDLHVPNVNIDFFCSPKYQDHRVKFLVHSGGLLNLGGGSGGPPFVTGRLLHGTISIGDRIKLLGKEENFFARIKDVLVLNKARLHTIKEGWSEQDQIILLLDLNNDHIDKFQEILSQFPMLVEAPEEDQESGMFRFRIKDIFTITGRGKAIAGTVEQGAIQSNVKVDLLTNSYSDQRRGNQYGKMPLKFEEGLGARNETAFLFHSLETEKIKEGDIIIKSQRENFSSEISNTNNPDTVQEMDFIGSKRTHINGFENKTVRFAWSSPDHKNRREFKFVARAYSTMPIDMPANFDDLNPENYRHIGGNSFPWQPTN
ncbi:hypothetical protein [Salinimicrobium sediminilitoris]|uniref:hypothetical protein n=1 Tax=Salinimicrobium sediminilitoris TaxID=2876715 RepID=UPI001E39A5E3|nr:hypothetical protein [Salinimicrobium sediminilitoris]MCC8358380.1 hypothetical protein [Salinimicrobium sediminilitoris]